MKFITILFIFFLVIGALMIIAYNDVDLSSRAGKQTFLKEYVGWIFNVGKSSVKTVGYAVDQDWLPDNPDLNETQTYGVYDKPPIKSKNSECDYFRKLVNRSVNNPFEF